MRETETIPTVAPGTPSAIDAMVHYIERSNLAMYIVLFDSPNGVQFDAAFEEREWAVRHLKEIMDNNEKEYLGWVQQVEHLEERYQ